jgi:hypothetical protein
LIRFSLRGVLLESCVWMSATLIGVALASAQPWQNSGGQSNDGPPVYQWHPTDGHPTDGHGADGHRRDERRDRRDFRRESRFVSPQVSANWFQRPYPYHLDYYKMRYGGSYAPYFGNLYGTPQVVNYPPYYGPYYGGNGDGYANGYGQPGYGGAPMAYPANPGTMVPGTEENSGVGQIQTNQPPAKTEGEALPVPAR